MVIIKGLHRALTSLDSPRFDKGMERGFSTRRTGSFGTVLRVWHRFKSFKQPFDQLRHILIDDSGSARPKIELWLHCFSRLPEARSVWPLSGELHAV